MPREEIGQIACAFAHPQRLRLGLGDRGATVGAQAHQRPLALAPGAARVDQPAHRRFPVEAEGQRRALAIGERLDARATGQRELGCADRRRIGGRVQAQA